jgi:nucleotide-binding universal stress UspA family protein
MKKILVATDLSPAARNAAEWGLKLAQAFDAKLTLACAYEQMPIPVTEAPVFLNVEDLRGEVQREVEQEKEVLKGETAVPVEALACEGSATPAILRVARARKADLIIVGMKRDAKGTRKWLGSTAAGLARKTSLPLLIVPEGVPFSPPKAIGLASDVQFENGFPLPAAMRELGAKLHSRLFIIRLFNRQAGELIEILHQDDGANRTICAFFPMHMMPPNESIAGSLNECLAASPIDLLVMKPHPRMGLERWFFRSETRQMIFKINIPLLVLPGEITINSIPWA